MIDEKAVENRITLTSLMLDTEEELFLKRHGCTVELETLSCKIIFPVGTVRTPTEQSEWGPQSYVLRLPDRTTLTENCFPDGKSQFIFPERLHWMYRIRHQLWYLRSLLGRRQ